MKVNWARVAFVSVAILPLLVATAVVAQERQGRDVFSTVPMPAPNQAEGIPTQLVEDGGFEAGSPNPFWIESSTNFGTPICDVTLCGTGGGSGPFAGTYWAWFGGIADFFEQGSVSQTIQGGADELCTLSFWLEIPATSGNGTDFLQARIGGVTVWSILESAGPIAPYTQITEDVSAFIDGTPQTLEFFSQISGLPDLSNFFVDDVALTCEALIFADGFESGDTLAWSNTAP